MNTFKYSNIYWEFLSSRSLFPQCNKNIKKVLKKLKFRLLSSELSFYVAIANSKWNSDLFFFLRDVNSKLLGKNRLWDLNWEFWKKVIIVRRKLRILRIQYEMWDLNWEFWKKVRIVRCKFRILRKKIWIVRCKYRILKKNLNCEI